MTDRRHDTAHGHDASHRLIAAALGLALGAALALGAVATREALLPTAHAAPVVVQVPYKPTRLICQPIKTPEVREAEQTILDADRYAPVMATDIYAAFLARSAGHVDLLAQTNMECFEPDWITQKFPADTYYQRPRGTP